MGSDENAGSHRLRGAIDGDVLVTIRDVFDRHEPLATATLDDLIDPILLTVELTAGLREGSTSRFDIQWTVEDDYKFHYVEGKLNFRWGHHPHDNDYNVRGYGHFHPPPNASSDPNDVQDSCFTVHRPKIITRGILKNWRAAFHEGLEEVNNPDQTA